MLYDYEMQHNAEVGLFTRPSKLDGETPLSCKASINIISIEF